MIQELFQDSDDDEETIEDVGELEVNQNDVPVVRMVLPDYT
jgi:hypothetical protein